MENVVIGDG